MLQVRNVPEELCGRIRSLASANGRPFDAEVVRLLEQALRNEPPAVRDEEARRRHIEALEDIRRSRHLFPKGKDVPDSTELLREDRAR